MNREILDFLKMNDVDYKEGQSLAKISPIKIGGVANIVAYPDSEVKLVRLIAFLEDVKMRHKIVGRMSNILFSKEGYDGVIIRTDRIDKYRIDGSILTTSGGVALPFISGILCRSGLSGFEQISGIPGSIAGAIIGNAGAFDTEISSRLTHVRYYDYSTDDVTTLDRYEIDFSYRSSKFKSIRSAVLSARFSLIPSDTLSVKTEMDRCRRIRLETQPTEMPSLGSTFKRPAKDIFAAKLIDECGLKGYRIGGAQISEKHAGFIVNTGGATAKNYIDLSNYAKACVLERFGIYLENEVEIV